MPELYYWNIRGLAQPIRFLLHYVGQKFEDNYFECGEAPEFNKDCWIDVKYKLGLDFPNLPYYVDGDIKVTQSNAILRYLGRKYKLDGVTEKEKVRVDIMAEEGMDFRNGMFYLVYDPKFNEIKPGYLERVKGKIDQFETFIGNYNYFAGNDVTFVDFVMYELLDQHRLLEPKLLADCPKLRAFLDRFEALPQIKAFMASDSFIKRPINNKMAMFM